MRTALVRAGLPGLLLALASCEQIPAPGALTSRPDRADAAARHVPPIFEAGNVTCADLLPSSDYDCDIKIGPPTDGIFPYTCGASSGSIRLDVNDTSKGQTVDWDILGRDLSIGTVVKGGPDANFYDYRPDGASEDDGLHSPLNTQNGKWYGLSHISFCIQERPCELTPTLTLYESCDEAFGYKLDLLVNDAPFALPDPNMDVDLIVDCGAGPTTYALPDLPDGVIPVPTDQTATCTVTASFAGTGDLEGCIAETTESVTVWPRLEATGKLTQACDGTFSWDTTIDGGSGSNSLLWTFDVVDGGTSSSATSTDASGTAVLSSGIASAASVTGQLVVTDGVIRDTAAGPEACRARPNVAGILALRPLQVSLIPTSGDGMCPEQDVGTVDFNAVVQGGSGQWDYDFVQVGDAGLDPTCRALDKVFDPDQSRLDVCSFDLGSAFCATGAVRLRVTDKDPTCLPKQDEISATRVTAIDVIPDPPG